MSKKTNPYVPKETNNTLYNAIKTTDKRPIYNDLPFTARTTTTTSFDDFVNRKDMKSEASTCKAVNDNYQKQIMRESKMSNEEKKKLKEMQKEKELHKFEQMNAEGKIDVLIGRADSNLNKTLNLHGGMLAKITDDLDLALDLLQTSENKMGDSKDPSSSGNWFVSDVTKERLYQTVAESHVHNWAYIEALQNVIHQYAEREEKYRDTLERNGIKLPYENDVESSLENPILINMIYYKPKVPDRGHVVSKYYYSDIQ